MKVIGITSTAILSLLLGIAAPAYAQHEQQGEKQDHAKQQQGEHEQGRPEAQHRAAAAASTAARTTAATCSTGRSSRVQQQTSNSTPSNSSRTNATSSSTHSNSSRLSTTSNSTHSNSSSRTSATSSNSAQAATGRSHSARQQQQRVQQSAWQQHRSQNWQSDHRNWQQRGGYHGYRIPDDRYRGYFGPSHGFRINALPFLVVGGYPRFQYEGYWISAVDPWPEYWGNDWYDNDDVYVNYVDNGYYLYNRRYPGRGIAINITL